MQLVNSYQDCVKYDGKIAIVSGKYNAIARPIKGSVQVDTEKKYAVIILPDEARVFLEPLDSTRSIRTQSEREEFNGQWVDAVGKIHRIMPSSGQSLINPCISDVVSIKKHEPETR